ncbi:MAG: molybdenum ABC transporter ATP-binding protein [Acidiphilium sp.]|nr:molybdenum ABC transporter ATP-binding protein [Acidiphilium sp.]MDD4935176.1 molybdenum ABC transporter ATP-binding protein [Acidiphilium sp.]
MEARFMGNIGSFPLDISFTAPAQGVTGLFGPSGCGKTTILRCLAGFIRLEGGYLRVGDAVWQESAHFLAPHKRPVGYVFQEPRLFAHLSVLDNLRYGLRRVRMMAPSIGLEPMIDLMGLRGLLRRSPAALSGGERQRVAIGRAILAQPRLLLMDEPLSALDRDAKNEILPYLVELPAVLSIPIIYVSHDFTELEQLADYLILMRKDGRVQASGALHTLLADISLPLARMPESAMILAVCVEDYDAAYDITACTANGVRILVPGLLGTAGTTRRLRVRASDVSLIKGTPQNSSVLNILPAHILAAEMASANQMLVLLGLDGQASETRLVSSITRKSWNTLALQIGDNVFAQIKGMALADAR